MTKLNLDYSTDNKGYTDGSVELTLKNKIEEGLTPEEILKEDTSWESLYHLSQERENILSWFPFKKDSRILEVGSGCGALTAILARNAKEVVSVELTRNRAEVNYARNKDLDNVEIIVGNLNDIKFDHKFDYIILNGVLEYAGSFTDSKKPYEDFLKNLKKHLIPDGMIITAIENRIGLKYLNGAPEDHSGALFSGVNNYPADDRFRTFTKKELVELFESVGFENLEFYYPYPDYKLPNLILNDDSLSLINAETADVNYNSNRLRFYDSITVTTTLLKEGILDKFMNSFLLLASNGPINIGIDYVKFPQGRKKEFNLVTTIADGRDRKVIKSARFPEALDHIKNIYQNYQNFHNDNFTLVPTSFENNSLIFDFIDSQTYEDYLTALLERGDKDTFKRELLNFKNSLLKNTELGDDFYSDEFKQIFGDQELDIPLHLKSDSNLDLIFSNIMHDKEKHIIDYEWIMNMDLPQEFVLFRSLYYFYYQNNLIRELLTFDELIDLINSEGEVISPEMIPVFIAWDEHFGNQYVGSGETLPAQTTLDVIDELNKIFLSMDDQSSLYVDTGEGFTEENRIKSKLNKQGDRFEVSFDLDFLKGKPIELIRWDPVEKQVRIEDIKVKTNKNELTLNVDNPNTSETEVVDDMIIFLSDDPSLALEGDYDGIDSITITGNIRDFSENDLVDRIESVKDIIREKEDEIKQLNRDLRAEKFYRLELEDKIHNLEE